MWPEAKKLVQIFKFLREFERLQNPQSYLIDDYQIGFFVDGIPLHPALQLTVGNLEDGSSAGISQILLMTKHI